MFPSSNITVKIIETKKISFDNPAMVIGLTGPGAVGSIAAQHIIKSLKMDEIAHVCSPLLPPVTIFIDGLLRRPFRIYGDRVGKIVVSLCEVPLPNEISYYISEALTSWAIEKGVSDVVILDGIPVELKTEEHIVFGAAETHILSKLKQFKIEPLRRGLISGLRAAILNQCLTLNLDGMIFLTPAVSRIPDPLAASLLIEKLNNMYGLKIDTEELLRKQEEIQNKLREITENVAKMQEDKTPRPSRYLA
ncbi:MAG: proteasome assembly chaperone family protein [Candidatus Ranarchaeia archaeon]